MAIIRAFKGLRPDPKVAHLVASVPYDVVNKEEAAQLCKGNPINFLRVTRSEIEMDSDTNPYSEEVYQKAKEKMPVAMVFGGDPALTYAASAPVPPGTPPPSRSATRALPDACC